MPHWLRERPLLATLTALLVAIGCALRISGAGALVIFGDEVHSLSWALGQDADWLAPYAPLGLWNTLAMRSIGLDEWVLRAPALAAGCGALALIAGLALRWLRSLECLAVVGFTALSPYLVYQSREARTYTIVSFLVIAAGIGFLGWLRRGGTTRLGLASAAAAMAIVFHTAVAATVGAALLIVAAEAARRDLYRSRARELAIAAAIFAAVLALGVGPIAGDVFGNVRERTGASSAGIGTVVEALQLGLGAALGPLPTLAIAIAALAGAVSLTTRFPLASSVAFGGLAAQLAALLWIQPTMLSVPWILLRYLAHGLPWLALCVGAGLATAVGAVAPKHAEKLGIALGVLGCTLFFTSQTTEGRYGALTNASQTMHPMLLQGSLEERNAAAAGLLPPFYRDVLPGLAPGALIEAPLVMTYPLYALYERAHGRPFYAAALGPGVFQHAARGGEGVELQRALDARRLPEVAPDDAAYLVVHKRPWDEILAASQRYQVATGSTHHIDPVALGHVFRQRALRLDRSHPLAASPIFEDDTVAVYELPPPAPSGTSGS